MSKRENRKFMNGINFKMNINTLGEIHCPGRDADEILMCRQIDKLLGRNFISYWYDVLKRMLA